MSIKARIRRFVDFEDFNQGECENCACARGYGDEAYRLHQMAFHSSRRDHALAMRIPLAFTGRAPKEIVADAEATWLADYIVK